MNKFKKELENLINSHSIENGSNTPDFILAEYLSICLMAFEKSVGSRDVWYGRKEENEGYPSSWINANLMINPETNEIHAIGGDRETGDGDQLYIGYEIIKKLIKGDDR